MTCAGPVPSRLTSVTEWQTEQVTPSSSSVLGSVLPFRRAPEKTAAAYNGHGWSTLGDLGHLDEDGYLYLSARRTDLILSGGVNIYPLEIENVLTMHPAVLDVAVVGLPDTEMGQRVHAVVTPVDGVRANDALADDLVRYTRERLAHFKAPRTVEFGDVPRLPSGKILRRVLLDRYGETSATP